MSCSLVHIWPTDDECWLGYSLLRDDPQSVIQPDSRVRDHGVLITLAPVPPAGRPVRIGARSYSGNLGMNSCTFIVDGDGAQWRVTGTTGIYSVS
jgi:hypothetical protein